MNENQELLAYTFTNTITSEVVTACLDELAKLLKLPTVVMMDKASFHTSNIVKAKLDE
jgi:hypothetical protein